MARNDKVASNRAAAAAGIFIFGTPILGAIIGGFRGMRFGAGFVIGLFVLVALVYLLEGVE